MDKTNKNVKHNKIVINHKLIKIKANTDFEINGRIYFIPDKYIGNSIFYLSTEHKNLYKIIFAMYLDILISNYKIENIERITKSHINDANIFADKLLSYILTGKVSIVNATILTTIEKSILEKIPENLLQNINPNIIEKIDA